AGAAPVADGEARAMLHGARLQAAYPYVTRWRPWVVTVAAALMFTISTINVAGHIEATIPLVIAALLSWTAMGAVKLGASPIDAALVLTFADLPIVAAWAMASPATGERLTTLLATLLISAWLLGPFPTSIVG